LSTLQLSPSLPKRVFGVDGADQVGLTDFCNYFQKLTGGCSLWAVALLAAGQSSAITTTYTGQYVMDGFLTLSIPMRWRAIITRLIAITPCVIVSIAFPNNLNQMVNIVNSSLSVLLPFAFTPS
jgi:NRAMP (natural resistance-associated macrophage protein)-like metal ion transporter